MVSREWKPEHHIRLFKFYKMIDYLNIPFGPLEEEWRDIPNYEGIYKVSNYGVIKSYDKNVNYGHGIAFRKGKIKAQLEDNAGYPKIGLQHNNINKSMSVHRIVAITFIPNPENKPQVNHKNRIRNDVFVSNFEWSTPLENMSHAIANNPDFHINQQKEKKLTKIQVLEIKELLRQKIMHRDIAIKYGVCRQMITNINVGKRWGNIL